MKKSWPHPQQFWNQRRVTVTGGAGFLGSFVVEKLQQRGAENIFIPLTGFEGEIRWDASKPNGQPRRKLDVSKAEQYFGFKSKTAFDEGLRRTIDWYQTSGERE